MQNKTFQRKHIGQQNPPKTLFVFRRASEDLKAPTRGTGRSFTENLSRSNPCNVGQRPRYSEKVFFFFFLNLSVFCGMINFCFLMFLPLCFFFSMFLSFCLVFKLFEASFLGVPLFAFLFALIFLLFLLCFSFLFSGVAFDRCFCGLT